MRAVMISIRPKWCGLIASGKKTIEVRKTKPKLDAPFKCYIYCTNERELKFWAGKRYSYTDDHSHNLFDRCGNGKVVGEFICDRIRAEQEIADQFVDVGLVLQSCLSSGELLRYADGKSLYSWHISDLKIYDEPKPLGEFKQCHKCEYYSNCYKHEYSCNGVYSLTRPPQSWCYVEEA